MVIISMKWATIEVDGVTMDPIGVQGPSLRWTVIPWIRTACNALPLRWLLFLSLDMASHLYPRGASQPALPNLLRPHDRMPS